MKVYDNLSRIEKQWYEMLKAGMENREEVFFCEGTVQPEWMNRILKAILVDNPQLFWFQGKWRLEQRQENCYMYPEYTHTAEEIAKGKEELQHCVEHLRVNDEKSPYEVAKYYYDILLEQVRYGMSKSSGQTAYDALIRKEAVCKGLSKAYQLLLTEAGINCTLAEGTIDGVAKHTWNVIILNGKSCHVDVSLGYEEFSYLYTEERHSDKYRCFAVSDEVIKLTNKPINAEY